MHHVVHRVQLNPDTCVPTCLGMLIEHAGKKVDQPLIDETALLQGRGVYGDHRGALRTAATFGLRAGSAYLKGDPQRDLARFCQLVEDRPVLVTGRFHLFPDEAGQSGHAIVVLGRSADGTAFVVHDPHHRKGPTGEGVSQHIEQDDFLTKWSVDHLGWVAWIEGPEHS